jgi:hypothetical protein
VSSIWGAGRVSAEEVALPCIDGLGVERGLVVDRDQPVEEAEQYHSLNTRS